MSSSALDILGFVAGVLTTAAFVPQVWRVWKTRSTTDISLATFLMFSVGVALWLAYGILANAPPVTAANAVTLVLALVILGFKLRYG
jgi:MtN3 and saliva related transmembrane protein